MGNEKKKKHHTQRTRLPQTHTPPNTILTHTHMTYIFEHTRNIHKNFDIMTATMSFCNDMLNSKYEDTMGFNDTPVEAVCLDDMCLNDMSLTDLLDMSLMEGGIRRISVDLDGAVQQLKKQYVDIDRSYAPALEISLTESVHRPRAIFDEINITNSTLSHHAQQQQQAASAMAMYANTHHNQHQQPSPNASSSCGVTVKLEHGHNIKLENGHNMPAPLLRSQSADHLRVPLDIADIAVQVCPNDIKTKSHRRTKSNDTAITTTTTSVPTTPTNHKGHKRAHSEGSRSPSLSSRVRQRSASNSDKPSLSKLEKLEVKKERNRQSAKDSRDRRKHLEKTLTEQVERLTRDGASLLREKEMMQLKIKQLQQAQA